MDIHTCILGQICNGYEIPFLLTFANVTLGTMFVTYTSLVSADVLKYLVYLNVSPYLNIMGHRKAILPLSSKFRKHRFRLVAVRGTPREQVSLAACEK